MIKKSTTNFRFLAVFACILFTMNAIGQQVYQYDFRNSFNEKSGVGPDLNVLGTGSFMEKSLPELSCLPRTIYNFTQNSGVQFDNGAANNFITGSYSVELYFQFLSNSGFKRLIDYKNRTSDFGLYATANELQFYDAITIPTTAFVSDQFVHLIVTRDSSSNEVALYVDGGLLGTFIDSTGLGLLDGSNVMNFFQDDLQFGGEARPGDIALLKVYDYTLDATAAASNFAQLKSTSNTLSFQPDITSSCLNGNTFNFTNTSENSPLVNYLWDFGDSNTATTLNAVHSYLADGVYPVSLVADDGQGCTDTVTSSVQVFAQPVVDLGTDLFICDSTSAIIDAGAGFAAYLWNDSTTAQTLTASVTGQYYVQVTDNNGCTASDSLSLTTVPLPVVDLGPDATICSGDSIQISAPSGLTTYVWSTGDTTESIYASLSGIYAVSVTNATGCVSSDTIEITVNAPYTITLGADTALCDGASLVLSPGLGYSSYLWNDNTTDSVLNVTAGGTYSVQVMDNFGCIANDSITIIFNQLPVVSLGQDTVFCAGTTVTLDGGAGYTSYVWNDGSQNQTFEVTTTGTYSVLVTDVNGCAGTDEITLTESPLVNLGADSSACDGQLLVLDAGSGLASYLWSDGSSAQTLDVTTSGQYTVTVTDASGCINSDTVDIVFNPLPVIDLGPDITACADVAPVLDAGAGFSAYLWSDGSTSQSLQTTISGVYAVTVINGFGCSASDDVSITLNDLPQLELGNDTTLCFGQTLTLDGGSGFSDYLWSDGSTAQTLVVSFSGTFVVTITNASGCIATDSINVIVNPLPVVSLGNDFTTCANTSPVLDAGAGQSAYLWSDGSTLQTLQVALSGTYTVTVTNASGCTASDDITITLLPSPVITLGNDTIICTGATVVLDPGAGYSSYDWNDGSSLQTLTVSSAGNYFVTVADSNNCVGTASINISNFAPIPTPVITQNNNILQSSSATGNQWYQVPGGLIPGATGNTYTPPQNGTFYVIVTDANGCQSQQSADFIFINTGITTVNEGTFAIVPNPAANLVNLIVKDHSGKEVKLELIDMIGKTVYSTEQILTGKITLDISKYPEGVYFLKISSVDFSSSQRLIISR